MRGRFRYCQRCQELHELGQWPQACLPTAPARSHLPAPYIITDRLPGGVGGMQSMADGKFYDSKSAYYASLKAHGCEIVGNDSSYSNDALMGRAVDRSPNDAEVMAAAKEAYEQLTSPSLSDDEMHNMVRAQTPAEDIIPNA